MVYSYNRLKELEESKVLPNDDTAEIGCFSNIYSVIICKL